MAVGDNIRGRVAFEAAGRSWWLSFSINALCVLEEEFEQTADAVGVHFFGEGAKPSLPDVRGFFWAGLQDHHPELTEREAGLVMTELGLARTGELVGRAFVGAFPPAAEGEKRVRPRRKPAGSGRSSSPPGASSASKPSSSGG